MALTPYYDDGNGIVIFHGDCKEIIDLIPSFDVVITDPPYGINGGKGGDSKKYGKGKYELSGWDDTPEYIEQLAVPVITKAIAMAKRAAVTPGIRNLRLYPNPTDMGCFWTPASCTHGPFGMTVFQPILYYGKDYRAGKGPLPTGRQLTEASEENGHPCPKPIKAWKWLVEKMSMQHETILDPFMGSGTTLRAAKDLGRKCIGIEIEEKYCEIAAKRLAQGVLDLA